MAMAENFEHTTTSPGTRDPRGTDQDNPLWRWLSRLVGTPRKSSIRQVYVVNNQDWLACKSNLTHQQAYDAIVNLYETVNDEQYKAAIKDLKNVQPPQTGNSGPVSPHP